MQTFLHEHLFEIQSKRAKKPKEAEELLAMFRKPKPMDTISAPAFTHIIKKELLTPRHKFLVLPDVKHIQKIDSSSLELLTP
jgi:hypothetical protein